MPPAGMRCQLVMEARYRSNTAAMRKRLAEMRQSGVRRTPIMDKNFLAALFKCLLIIRASTEIKSRC